MSGINYCRAILKVNSLGWVAVGACVPSAVAANGYEGKGNFHCYAGNYHGTFVIWNNGNCYTHGDPGTSTAFKFSAGESVSVEWDEARCEISWAVLGTDRRHTMTVPIQHLQTPLHFVVGMRDCDVTLKSE